MLESPEFVSGVYATDLVDRIRARAQPAEPSDAAWIAAAIALTGSARAEPSAAGGVGAGDPWDEPSGWRAGA